MRLSSSCGCNACFAAPGIATFREALASGGRPVGCNACFAAPGIATFSATRRSRSRGRVATHVSPHQGLQLSIASLRKSSRVRVATHVSPHQGLQLRLGKRRVSWLKGCNACFAAPGIATQNAPLEKFADVVGLQRMFRRTRDAVGAANMRAFQEISSSSVSNGRITKSSRCVMVMPFTPSTASGSAAIASLLTSSLVLIR